QQDSSVTAAMLAVGTMSLLVVVSSYVTFRWSRTSKVMDGVLVIIVRNGRVQREIMKIERLTEGEGMGAARQQRIADLRAVAVGITVKTFEGQAWAPLVLFRMRVHPPVGPAIPRVGVFPEINLRTYVTGPDGGHGVWFASVEAGKLAPSMATRGTLSLPYCWSTASIRRRGDEVEYRCRRRWPGPTGVGCLVRGAVGERIGGGAGMKPRDDFLVSRYRLYTRVAGVMVAVDVDHLPWELHAAEVVTLQEDL